MHLHPYCFSYAIVDPELRKIMAFDAQVMNLQVGHALSPDSIAAWFAAQHDVFSLPFSNCKVAVYAPQFSVLPGKTEKPAEFFRMLGYAVDEQMTFLKNKIQEEFYVYYTLSDKIINYIENQLPNVEFFSGDHGLLHFYNPKLSFRNYLAANLYGEDLTICYKKNGQDIFYNKFTVKAKEDLLYFLRLAYEKLELSLNEFPTYLYGFIEEKSPMYSTSYGYIRNFEIDRTLKNTLPYLYATEDIPLHYYINLLGLGL